MTPPGRAEARERLPLGTVLAYGGPIGALTGWLFFVQFFFLKFATDVLLIAPAVIGVIFALGRAWDAISDPIVGTWSDRTRTRLGRRRPWMLAALPLLAIFFAMTWMPPQSLTGAALVAWVAVSLFGFYTAYTAYGIPHQSLGAELTRDYHDRNRVFGVRHASFVIGMMLSFAGMQIVNNAADPRAAAAELAAVVIPIGAAILLLPPLLIRERREHLDRRPQSSFGALADVVRNPHARRLLLVNSIEMMGAGVLGVLSPFLAEYVLERPDLIGPLPAVFVVSSVVSIPVWIRLARRFGKRNTWIAAMIATALSFGGMFFAGPDTVVLAVVLLAVAGAAQGCGGTVGPSILADVIDWDEWATGQRKEGAYSAAWGFTLKGAQAVVILLAGWVLQLSGFEPNAEQTPTANLALRSLFAGLPFFCFLIGAWLFAGFQLDRAEHARIRGELDARGA